MKKPVNYSYRPASSARGAVKGAWKRGSKPRIEATPPPPLRGRIIKPKVKGE